MQQNKQKEELAAIKKKSFKFLHNKITSYLQERDFKNLIQQGDPQIRTKLVDPNNPVKWNGVALLTRRVCDDLIVKLSEQINLEEMQTFDLIEAHCINDDEARSKLAYIRTLDEEINKSENYSNVQGNYPLYQKQMSNSQVYRAEFKKATNELIYSTTQFYFQERVALVNCILSLLIGIKNSKEACNVNDLVKKELFDKRLVGNLIQSLEQNKRNIDLVYINLNPLRDILLNLQREEISILQSMVQIFRYFLAPTSKDIVNYLKYQLPDFQGINLPLFGHQSDQLIQSQSKVIQNLSVLQTLNLLNIHLFSTEDGLKSQDAEKVVKNLFSSQDDFRIILSNLCKDIELDDAKATIYLAFRQIIMNISTSPALSQHIPGQIKNNLMMEVDQKLNEMRNYKITDFVTLINDTNNQLERERLIKNSDVDLIIQDWINIVYPYFRANSQFFDQDIQKCQNLTFEVLEKPNHLNLIWQEIDRSHMHIFKRRSELVNQNVMRPIKSTLDIFEAILSNPEQDLSLFLRLLIRLLGPRIENKGDKLFDLLNRSKLNQVGAFDIRQDQTLMAYLITQFLDLTGKLYDNKLSQHDFKAYNNLCIFISKLISYNNFAYDLLNHEALIIVNNIEMDGYDFETLEKFMINDPLLLTLLQSIHQIIYYSTPGEISKPLHALLKAITKIYKIKNVKTSILNYIGEMTTQNGQPILLEFFLWNLQEYETVENQYRITSALLKFLNVVFSVENPWHNLPDFQRTNLDYSILSHLLEKMFGLVASNFSVFAFKDMKDFFRLYTRILKLTNTILKKFKDGNPLIKAPLSQAYPTFDWSLKIFMETLNSQNIEQLILNALLLSENSSNLQTTGMTNKFWVETLKQTKLDISIYRLKCQKMIKSSLRCLNTLLDLSYQTILMDDLRQEQQFGISARAFYGSQLAIVQSVSNSIKNPAQWDSYSLQGSVGTNLSVFNIIQYYIRPHQTLCPFMSSIQLEALKFFMKCSKIWETQPQAQRVSLETIVRTTGLSHSEVLQKYVMTFEYCRRNIEQTLMNEFLNVFMDLLILCCSSQSQFVEDIFRDKNFRQTFMDLLDEIVKPQFNDNISKTDNLLKKSYGNSLQTKFVILISEMSRNRISDEFILNSIIKNQSINKIFQGIISKFIDEVNTPPHIDIDGRRFDDNILQQENIRRANKGKLINLVINCEQLIGLRYYFSFLQYQYQMNQQDPSIRTALKQLFSYEKLAQVSMKINSQTYYQSVLKINRDVRSFDERNKELLKNLIQNIQNQQKLTHIQLDLISDVKNKYVAENFEVFLNNLDAQQLFTNIHKKQQPFHFLQIDVVEDQLYGLLGQDFMINTDELIETLLTYFYDNEELLSVVRGEMSSFNMLLSYLYSYNQFTVGLRDIIINIGKSRMRENLKQKDLVINNLAFSTSLLNIAIQEDINEAAKNKNNLALSLNIVAKIMLDIAKPITRKYLGQDQMRGIKGVGSDEQFFEDQYLHFEYIQTETELDLLTICLGVVNTIAQNQNLSQENLNTIQNDIIQGFIKCLPRVRQNQINKIVNKDLPQTLKFQSDKEASKLYISLVLQVFSLNNFINKSNKMNIQVTYQNDVEYLTIMGQTLQIMQEGGECFIDGLKILEQGFSLVSNENILYFMRKQDISPLRIIMQRFLNSNLTTDDDISVCVTIIEFLTNYARIEDGAKHLVEEKILQTISSSQVITLVNTKDFYIEVGTQTRRNPIHVLWCHILILVRTINHILVHENNFRKLIYAQIDYFSTRITSNLRFGAQLILEKFDHKYLSLALFEELELITGLIQQYFDYCDEFASQDYAKYSEIKDDLLFSIVHFFSIDLGKKPVLYSSETEKYFNSLTIGADKVPYGIQVNKDNFDQIYTGLKLTVQVQQVRIFNNVVASLLNMLSLNQELRNRADLLNTWDVNEYRSKSQYGASKSMYDYGAGSNLTYLSYNLPGFEHKGPYNMKIALDNFLQALQCMNDLYCYWGAKKANISQLYNDVYGQLEYDEWISTEYQGLNNFFASETFEEVAQKLQQSLDMGYMVAILMVQALNEEVREHFNLNMRMEIESKDIYDCIDQIRRQYYDFRKANDEFKFKMIFADFDKQIDAFADVIKNDKRMMYT